MRKHNGYSSYRGRSTARTVLKVVAVLLAIVLAGAVYVFFRLEQYMVYSADGVRLVLPWVDPEPDPAESQAALPPVVPTEELVVVTPEPKGPEVLRAAALPDAALYDGTAQAQVDAAGANAALFDMKKDDGSLGYVSALDLAKTAKASADDPALNAAIQLLNAGELYTVARVSCFKDDKLSDADRALNITTNSGYRWTDPEGLKWSSPTSHTVRDYVTGVCLELAGLGFDEILLDNAGYPTQGNLGYIKKGAAYDASAFDTVIGGFYADVKAALAQQYPDVKLSIALCAPAADLDGADTLSGQTAKNLAAADRIYCRSDGSQAGFVRKLTEAGMEDADARIVILTEETGGDEGSWARIGP